MQPVGSGPYKLQDASPERVVIVRDDNYWGKTVFGGLPKPQYIVHPIFKSNDDGNLAFQQGQLDISQQFTPVIQGITLLITTGVLIANFIVDIVYGFIDPRIRAAQTG